MSVDIETLKRLHRQEYALPPDFEVRTSVTVDGPMWDAVINALDAGPSAADITALRELRFTKQCECVPQLGDHDYGFSHPVGCPVCNGTGEVIDWAALIEAVKDAKESDRG